MLGALRVAEPPCFGEEKRDGSHRGGDGGVHGKECIDLTFSAPSGALVLDAQQQLGAAVELEGAALSPGDHTGLR